MQYRKLPRGTEQISVLGIGTSSIQASNEKEIEKIITAAMENGINYFDMASSEAKPFAAYGRAIKGMRDKAYFQIHFGANYETGVYGWTTDLDTMKRSVDWQLKALQTDYIDFGFLHCIDESADLHEVEKAGVIRYMEELKEAGVVRHIGLSSHTPLLVNEVLDMGILDMLMFSINPAYDYAGGTEPNYAKDSYAVGSVAERMNLYRRCEAEGVGISVMKAFSGGQLLKAVYPFFEYWYNLNDCEYLLSTPEGEHFKYRNYYDSYWSPLIETLGMKHRPHDTRHTCISMLTVAGVSDKVIKKIVGHKGQGVTEVVYTHFEIEELIDAINKI